MRKVGAILLSVSLSFSGSVRAEDQVDLGRLAERYGAASRVGRLVRRADRSAKVEFTATSQRSAATEILSHQIQTFLLMMIITGVEIVRSNIEIAHLKRENVDANEIARMSAEAAEQILIGGGTWASLLGMGAAGWAAKRPLQWLNAYVENAVTRPLLKALISSGIASVIAFVGWDVAGQLWDEARELIEDDADYERSAHIGAALFGAPLSADDRRVLGLMVSNVFQIIFTDSDLRSLWLYNAWRKRIATGQFVTLITSMVTAGAVGTAVFPGAGTFVFGVVGGTVAGLLPETTLAHLTNGIAATRVRYQTTKIEQAFDDLGQTNESVRTGVAGVSAYVRQETTRAFAKINGAMDDALSARFEIIYRLHARANVLTGNRRIAVDPADQVHLDTEIAKANIRLGRAIEQAADHAEAEARLVLAAYPGGPDPELQLTYQREAFTLGRIGLILRQLARVAPTGDHAASVLLNKVHVLGFRAGYLE